ncbi:glycosyltransferase family 4 protein [Methylobacter sp.]|uniref:glycosyltransferase family 4 protein n=1 Tax=Methylobacter sp. TaxID=2051955 RepID=UPI003DA469F7
MKSSKAPGSKMREVAYLINQYPAPSHSFIRREIHALEARGWTVHRFAHRRSQAPLVDPLDRDEEQRTCVLLDSSLSGFLVAGIYWLIRHPWRTVLTLWRSLVDTRTSNRRVFTHLGYFALACALSRRLQELGYPHLHVHFGTNPADVARLCRSLCNLTYSVTFHGPHEYETPDRLNLAGKIAGASFIAVISGVGRQAIQARYPGSENKLITARCGLDAVWLTLPAFPVTLAPRLVSIARLDDQKNPLLLIEAAALLAARGITFELALIGDGALRAEVEHQIARYGLESSVRLCGWSSQQLVLQHLQACRALVLSSHDEGLPVAIMESYAVGRPAIAPDVGAVRELVETGITGWLVPPRDPVALADAIQECLETPEAQLQALGWQARKHVQALHHIDTSANLLAAAFDRVKSGKSISTR